MEKILFVVDERKMGGVSILLEDYLKNIDRKEKQVDVLVLHNNGECLENLPSDINIRYIGNELDVIDESLRDLIKDKRVFKTFKKLVFSFYIKTGYIKNVIKKIRKKYEISGYDVEVGFKDGFCHIFTAYGDSKKKIGWLHTDYVVNNFIAKYKKTFVNVFEKLNVIVAISSDVKERFCKMYGNDEKTVIIHNYVDEKKVIEKSKEECNLVTDKSKINLICIGRLSHQKGYDRLLEALHKLNTDYDDLDKKLCINVLGGGEDKESLSKMQNAYNLEGIINFLGNQSNPYKFIQKHDMLFLPSRYEAYGLVIIESLINKVPVITTRVATTDDVTEYGKYGVIVSNDLEGVYSILKDLVDKKVNIDEYKEIVKDYSYEEKNKEIIQKVNKLLEFENK